MRTDIINQFIKTRGYIRYLEIGVGNPLNNFHSVQAEKKVGVDPAGGGTHDMTSDAYFETSQEVFDIVFIDGLHLCEQVIRDVENSLEHLSLDGVIVLHDCKPEVEIHQRREVVIADWTGDVWKAFVYFRSTRLDLKMFTVDTDWGIGVIQRGHQELFLVEGVLDWEFFCQHKEQLLNLKTVEEFESGKV